MKAGETFHAPSRSGGKKHLWIAVTAPDSNGEFVIANVTSHSPTKDQSCTLDVGDYPFIKKQSVINYAGACVTDVTAIQDAARANVIQYDVAVSAETLAKVQVGALVSNQIEPKVKAVVKAALGIK